MTNMRTCGENTEENVNLFTLIFYQGPQKEIILSNKKLFYILSHLVAAGIERSLALAIIHESYATNYEPNKEYELLQGRVLIKTS